MDAYDGKLLGLMRELGDIIEQDDGPDIGKFDRIHHWHIGAAIKYGSDFIRWGLALAEVERFMGAPVNDVDRLEAQFYAIMGNR